MFRSFPNSLIGWILCALVLAVLAVPAQGQDLYLWPAKFVCGFETGDVPLLSTTNDDNLNHPYEELKPGNYATLINIINYDLGPDITQPTQTVYAYVSVEETGTFHFLGSFSLTFFENVRFGCPEIAATLAPALPTTLTGQTIEGYVTLLTLSDELHMDRVHTYESKDAFKEHIVRGVTEDGVLQKRALDLVHGGFKLPTFPPVSFFRTFEIAASGAGGLGLGASIDVEKIEPRLLVHDGCETCAVDGGDTLPFPEIFGQ